MINFRTAQPLEQIEAIANGHVFSAVEHHEHFGDINPYYVDILDQ